MFRHRDIDKYGNWGEPMGAPAIFEKQIEIKLLHPASTLESRIQALNSAS
ncbi:MAG: hypothetical protein P8X79_18840 [Reinekea sp.]